MNADVRVMLSVNGQRGGYFHVGAVEILKLGFPIVVFKFEEQRAENGGFVESRIGEHFDVGRADMRTGLRRFLVAASKSTRRTEAAARRAKPRTAGAFLFDEVSRCLSFFI